MKKKKIFNWLPFVLAIIYLFLPTDIIPDIPIVGMIDDAAVIIIAKVLSDKFGVKKG